MIVNVLMIFKESYEILILLNLRIWKLFIYDKLVVSLIFSFLVRFNFCYVFVLFGY